MARLGTEIASILGVLSSDSARLVRIERVRSAYARAVRKVWGGNPTAVRLVLGHTNAVYVRNDERPRKGEAKDRPYILCEVYADDSTVRAELDTWQQILRLALTEQGVTFDEFRILPSKMGMKERHPFAKLLECDLERMDALLADGQGSDAASAAPVATDEENLRRFRRAAALTFGEAAPSVLAKMNEVRLVPVNADDAPGTRRLPAFFCTVLSSEPTLRSVLGAYDKKLRDNARLLGLRLRSLRVLPWNGPAEQRAFPDIVVAAEEAARPDAT